jgi:DNA uptake protein ComE-like DNA-binding protein
MERFDDDWATAKIASQFAAHLRNQARDSGELLADPHYTYLKNNSAKRRKDAPRGTRPYPEPSEAGPSSLPNINTAEDEEMMDKPGLFGFDDPSDDEGGTDFEDDEASEGEN